MSHQHFMFALIPMNQSAEKNTSTNSLCISQLEVDYESRRLNFLSHIFFYLKTMASMIYVDMEGNCAETLINCKTRIPGAKG